MDQRNDRTPNPSARPDQHRGNVGSAGGANEQRQESPPTGPPHAEARGAFGKEGHSNRRTSVDNTGAVTEANERSGLDDDTPASAVGDPHLTRAKTE